MNHNMKWYNSALFYHIYPLGFCGASTKNDRISLPVPTLDKILLWIPHLKNMGVTALYLGPVFESHEHGYETIDYFTVDRRLGTNETLRYLIENLHENGIRVVLDAVFNHTGRDFFAFKDLLANRENSKYRDLYNGIEFSNSCDDGFHYNTWDGYGSMVKLQGDNCEVQNYFCNVISSWIEQYDIDGVRFDAADTLSKNFIEVIASHARTLKDDFWLMGEVVHGNYNDWMGEKRLDSITNYECYKGLFSSCNDKNMFEIAYSLNRLFGLHGLYKDRLLYNFLDNHDVSRIGTTLKDRNRAFPLMILLFTMPGIPSLYYGSEWLLEGKSGSYNDRDLRPSADSIPSMKKINDALVDVIRRLSKIRVELVDLIHGDYSQLFVSSEHLIFRRGSVVIGINISTNDFVFDVPGNDELFDVLNHTKFENKSGKVSLSIPANWGGVFV